jgi:hypothetical protein
MTNIIQSQSTPYIFATLSSAATNVTGDGTVYTCIWNTLVSGSGYNTGTGIFTCAVPGDYLFSPFIYVSNVALAHTLATATIVATAGSFQTSEFRIGTGKNAAAAMGFTPCIVPVKMAAGDTAQVNIMISGSTKVISFDTLSTLSIVRIR